LNYILKKSATTKLKEKRSEFIAHTKSITTIDDLNTYIKELRSKYYTARHFCWAYRIFENEQITENSSDAGEPSGSAGIPILNALKKHNIVNCSIIVVRNFGGVKLGKQGLIKAYRTAAELVIAESDLLKWEPIVQISLNASMNFYGLVMQCIKQFEGKIVKDKSTDELYIIAEIRMIDYSKFGEQFREVTQNSGKIKKQSERDQTKEVRK